MYPFQDEFTEFFDLEKDLHNGDMTGINNQANGLFAQQGAHDENVLRQDANLQNISVQETYSDPCAHAQAYAHGYSYMNAQNRTWQELTAQSAF